MDRIARLLLTVGLSVGLGPRAVADLQPGSSALSAINTGFTVPAGVFYWVHHGKYANNGSAAHDGDGDCVVTTFSALGRDGDFDQLQTEHKDASHTGPLGYSNPFPWGPDPRICDHPDATPLLQHPGVLDAVAAQIRDGAAASGGSSGSTGAAASAL